MIRFKAMFFRILKEMIRDKRTLALMFLAPLMGLTLMNITLNPSQDTVWKIGVDASVPESIKEKLASDTVKIKSYGNTTKIKDKIKENNLDAFLYLEEDTFYVTYKNDDPATMNTIKGLFKQVLHADTMADMRSVLQKSAQQTGISATIQQYKIKNFYVYGDQDQKFFDKIFPISNGFFVFFYVFLISGIALLRERTSGTLERLLATPIKRSEIILGYLAGYGVVSSIQTLLIVLFSTFVLQVNLAGNLGWVLVINFLLALVALVMGIFISTFATSEFQMMQFIPIMVLPQVFFSGIVSLDTMPNWARPISYIFPLTYGGDALTSVMLKGEGWMAIWPNLAILLLYVMVFTLINIWGLKKYRKV